MIMSHTLNFDEIYDQNSFTKSRWRRLEPDMHYNSNKKDCKDNDKEIEQTLSILYS